MIIAASLGSANVATCFVLDKVRTFLRRDELRIATDESYELYGLE